ncbi:MAG: hypothetical protein JO352_23920 [Chloroflexi bacterium]|nr:hypothetical protein [Chloroflexota bacterium]
MYFTTGYGDLTANLGAGRNYGDCVVKLSSGFGVADYFAPSDQPDLLAQDIDLGSGGVLVSPDPPPGTDLLPLPITCDKDGQIFLINRNHMGHYTPGGPDNIVQKVDIQCRSISSQPGVWGGPAYYGINQQHFVYYCGNNSHLRAYVFSGAALTFTTQSPSAFPSEGGVTPNVATCSAQVSSGPSRAAIRSGRRKHCRPVCRFGSAVFRRSRF